MEVTRREFATIRSGKATTSLLDLVRVNAYGNEMPLNQVASVAAPEPRLLTVTPWDKSLTTAIDKGLRESDLGLNPVDPGRGDPRAPAAADRGAPARAGEGGAQARRGGPRVRPSRAADLARTRSRRSSTCRKTTGSKADHDLQKVTDDHIKHIDEMVKAKEAEIMEV